MKDLKPFDTFLLTLTTVAILVGVSLISVPEKAPLGITKIDMFSALNQVDPSTIPIVEGTCSKEDYSVDYVQNDIVSQKKRSDSLAAKETFKKGTTIEIAEVEVKNDSLPLKIQDPIKNRPSKIATLKTPDKKGEITALNTHNALNTSSQPTTTPNEKAQTSNFEGTGGTAIENAATLAPFFAKLRASSSANRPVRIAVLGDSFIEGDIFTQDLREMFQDRFGGRGVGFVPMASGVAAFRQTVQHSFSGWASHCISTAARRGNYTISSYTFTPGDGSVARYSSSDKRRHLDQFSRARLMFINGGNTTINVKVNNGEAQTYTPASVDKMQQITVAEDSITQIEYSFRSTDSFIAYGVYLDGSRGVAVDNYSVRGNSGMSLVSTSIERMTQMNALMPVDMIIFEYGLNVAGADTRSYTQYHNQMLAAINHIKQAYPDAAILIMSVPDRAHRTAAGWQTMPGIVAMEKSQRQLAAECGAAFWSTMKNMQAMGGMGVFVEKGWAAKDYTHLSHRGGRAVARSLFDAFMVEYGN